MLRKQKKIEFEVTMKGGPSGTYMARNAAHAVELFKADKKVEVVWSRRDCDWVNLKVEPVGGWKISRATASTNWVPTKSELKLINSIKPEQTVSPPQPPEMPEWPNH